MATHIRAACQCGQLSVTTEIPNDKLPIDMYLRSCDTCRWLSGHLTISSVYTHQAVEVFGKAIKYTTSTGPQGLKRCFCPDCGTFVYEDSPDPSVIGLYNGAIEDSQDLIKLKGTIWTSSTRDGGLSIWLPNFPAWEQNHDGKEAKPQGPILSAESNDRDEPLRCECFCGGISFQITRPNEDSYKPFSAYSDAVVPFHAEEAEIKNIKDEKWWIQSGGTKYAATVCACNSCRRSSGQDVVQWAFVPLVNMRNKDETQFKLDSGTLKSHTSSKGVKRHFCSVCGAKAFWTGEERPDLIDIGVGLLRSKAGSRAEDWLEWLTERISFVEDGEGRELVHALKKGMKLDHVAKQES